MVPVTVFFDLYVYFSQYKYSEVISLIPHRTQSLNLQGSNKMASTFLSTGVSGALFGSALLVSGVYSPAVISSQLALSDFYMLKVFLTANASSA